MSWSSRKRNSLEKSVKSDWRKRLRQRNSLYRHICSRKPNMKHHCPFEDALPPETEARQEGHRSSLMATTSSETTSQTVEEVSAKAQNFYPKIFATSHIQKLTNLSGNVHPIVQKLLPLYQNNLPQAGRIKHFHFLWEKLTRDPSILEIVHGWTIPLVETPHQKSDPAIYRFQNQEKELISKEVANMLEKGAIVPVAQIKGQFISNLFLREKKDGGHRPIINLKKLNAFIPYLKFKMESIKNIKDLLSKGDYMVKIDLKDAYFSIPLNHESRKFVRFKWEGNLYEFVCLTFGIGPAPRIFSRLLKVPISLIRKLKIRIVIYIDDMLVMAATLSEKEIARDTVIQIFQALGFVINFAKSDLTPKQIMEFLGIIVNSIEMTFSIPQAKIEKLTKISLEMLEKGEPSVRELSSIIGKLRATAPAFTHAPLQVRYLQLALIEAQHQGKTYAKTVKLNEKARLELQWWPENMEILNGKPINIQPPDLTISSDAARTGGWGAECNGQITGGVWNQEESNLHINVQELIAAQLALKTFTKLMKGSSVHLMIDNTSALSHLAKMGGTKHEMMIDLSKEIWSYLTSKQITFTLEWIPSKLNVEADWASRNWQDASEWKLDPLFFQKVCKTLGFPEIDAFASRTYYQLTKYFS